MQKNETTISMAVQTKYNPGFELIPTSLLRRMVKMWENNPGEIRSPWSLLDLKAELGRREAHEGATAHKLLPAFALIRPPKQD